MGDASGSAVAEMRERAGEDFAGGGTIRVMLYKAPGDVEAVPVGVRKEAQLTDLQVLVGGGLIEVVPFPGERDLAMVVNESGKLKNMDPNLVLPADPDFYRSGQGGADVLMGPVVFVRRGVAGSLLALEEGDHQKVADYVKRYGNIVQVPKGSFSSFRS